MPILRYYRFTVTPPTTLSKAPPPLRPNQPSQNRTIPRKTLSHLPPLSKGGGLTAMHKLLLCCFLLAICPPFLYCKLFCCQDGGIVLRQHNYFNRHNLNRHFGAKRRSQHFAMTATYQIITLYNPAVPPSSANCHHFQRRNCQRRLAA